ncbi:MAG: TonB-dependent receptor [Spirochaetales bacterium]|uniref:TonB-dependent receptor n=1 Tax=Candidatus Thalassospirochaeta sargassi TaxID=3119039 RepID=A0AAJ1IKZ7_9SPIO|nr:TonB-dependent receptor [Spirochaetales bacterium]
MLSPRNKILLLIFIIPALPSSLLSADEVFDFTVDAEIVIEDTYVEENPDLKPGQVTVIDKEDIETSGARTVADVVERVPGVVVSRQGGILEQQSVSIRGGESEHVLILIDGKAVDSLWTGASDLSSITVSNVERIEVIRGSAAALYGEGAISGVINIITTGDPVVNTSSEVEYGFASYNTHSLQTTVSGPLSGDGGLSGELSAGGLYTGGGYEYETSEGEVVRTNNDGWVSNTSGKLDYGEPEDDEAAEFSVSGSLYASEKGSAGLMEFLTPYARLASLRGGGGADLILPTADSGEFSAALDYSYKYARYTNYEDDSADETDETNKNHSIAAGAGWTRGVEFRGLYADLSIDGGYQFDYLYSTSLTDSSGSALDGNAFQHAADLRASMSMLLGRFDITPAAGFDFNYTSYEASDTTSNTALTWSVSGGFSPFRDEYDEGPLYMKLNIGTGFRNPSFQDLFWPSGAIASGNPDLEPETSINWDGGVFYTAGGRGKWSADIEAVGFFSIIDDLIQWMPTAGGVWRPSNVGYVYSGGAESSLKIRGEEVIDEVDMEVSLVYNWLKCVDADSDSVNFSNQLAYRPEHSGNIALLFSLPQQLSLETAMDYIGYRYTNNANTKYLDQVFLISATFNYDFNEHFRLTLSGDNLLNQSYIDRLGYPVPGIELCIKGRLSL